MFGVFRVKNHDFTPKNQIFFNFRGGGGAPRVRPPWIRPCYVQPVHVHEVYMMTNVWSGPSYQHYWPLSMQTLTGIKLFLHGR